MQVLRRDTLEWEKLKYKGKGYGSYLTLSDNKPVDFINCLAVKGKHNFKNLGYCSCCNKIMTLKEFEKHNIQKANYDMCKKCYNLCERDTKITKSNGEYHKKSTLYCSRYGVPINPSMDCLHHSCNGTFYTDIPEQMPRIPTKIITLKKLLDNGWDLYEKTSLRGISLIKLKYKKYDLYACVDENGFLSHFKYNGDMCYYDSEKDILLTVRGWSVTENETILKIIRRLYK